MAEITREAHQGVLSALLQIAQRRRLAVLIIWLSFSAWLMVPPSRVAQTAVRANAVLLTALVLYLWQQTLGKIAWGMLGGAVGIFALFAPGALALDWDNMVRVLALPVYVMLYLTVRGLCERREIIKQVITAGWFVWLWAIFCMGIQFISGQRVNAASTIVFHPSYGCLFFVMLLPFGLEIESRRLRRAYLLCGAVVCLSVGAQSRAGMMALCTVCAAWGLLQIRSWRQRLALTVLTAIGAAALLGWLATLDVATVQFRLEQWRGAVQLFKEHPLFGVGLGRYWVWSSVEHTHAGFAHNGYLTVIAETGLSGAVLLAAALWLYQRTWAYRPLSANLSLLAFAVHNLFDDPAQVWSIAVLVVTCVVLTTRETNT